MPTIISTFVSFSFIAYEKGMWHEVCPSQLQNQPRMPVVGSGCHSGGKPGEVQAGYGPQSKWRWQNSLPLHIRQSQTYPSFRHCLKMHCFQSAYPAT